MYYAWWTVHSFVHWIVMDSPIDMHMHSHLLFIIAGSLLYCSNLFIAHTCIVHGQYCTILHVRWGVYACGANTAHTNTSTSHHHLRIYIHSSQREEERGG